MLINGYSDFSTRMTDPIRMGSLLPFEGARLWVATFTLDADVSALFPYINAVIEDAVLYENTEFMHFTLEGYRCMLRPKEVDARFFEDREQALRFADRLVNFLNDLDSRKGSLKPNYERFRPIPALEILKVLPGTNCQVCGYPTCTAFAVALSKGDTIPERCPVFSNPISEDAVYPILDDKGNVVSTITIGIKTSRMRLDIEQQKKDIRALTESLVRISEKPSEPKLGEAEFGLTEREVEVLRLVAEGLTNTEISNSLFISPHTVKSHIIHIFNKLGVNDRTQAAVLATRYKIV